MIKVFVSTIACLAGQISTFSSFKLTCSMATVAFCLLVNLKPAVACHDTEITNLVVVDNGDGTFTYTIDLTVDVGSFDGYGYGFALVFLNSASLPPTVLNTPAFTPQVTRPGYDPLIGYTGANIGSGPIPFFSARYGNRSDVLTYETTDDWFGIGSTDYSATISVTVSGCIEEISLDGDFRSLGNAPGDPSCVTTISTGFTCCTGPPLTGTVEATICPGETFVYFGTTYDENNTSGTELLSTPEGCDSVVTVNLTIDQNCCNPQTSAISGPVLLCQNATGNSYSVINTPGSTYTWTVPTDANIAAGQGTNSITVDFGIIGGQITVVETQQCGDGQPVLSNVVLEPTQNLVITNPAAVCEPNTLDLTASAITSGSTGGGTLSYWTNANATASLANPSAVLASGTYYIQAGTGNCSDIQPVTVTINNCVSCSMDNLTLSMTDCYASGQGNLQYDIEGVLTYTDAPNTGTLTVTDCYSNQQVFNPPFNGTQTFSFSGLPQDGLNCDFTAVFSDDSNCTVTSGFIAPPSVTYFESNCVSGSGQVDGTIEFNNPPASGTIVVEVSDGSNTQITNIQPPFSSPEAWQVTGLDPSATNYVITYYFSDFPSCQQSQSIICGCSASGGTTSGSIIGNGLNEFILCDGDQLDIVSNNDFTFPADEGPLVDANGNVFPYQPAYVYLVYSCPPTSGVFPGDDACLQGIVESNGMLTDVNDSNSIFSQFPNGTFTNNQLYYVPVTLYHYDPVAPAYIFNSNCWALGTSISATYLTPVVANVTESCQTNTITVDVSGGYPEVFGGDFTASNLLPATASFVNSNAGNGGAIIIEGLQNGDNYSFDITDENGCPVTVSGGPFVAMPIANAGDDAQSCGLDFNLSAIASYGMGEWTGGPIGTTFTPNANAASASVMVPTAGTYTFTWTENNGNGCVASDEVEIIFSELSISAVVTDASCASPDGEVSVSPQGGVAPYSYVWTTGGSGPVESNLAAGNVMVTVTDGMGCSLDSTFIVSQPATFNYVLNTVDVNCFGACDGQIDIQPDGQGPYSYIWSPNVSSANSSNSLCQGDYEIEITDQNGCVQVVNTTIGGSSEIAVQMNSDVIEVCIGGTANLSSIVTGGVQPYTYLWTANPVDPSLDATSPNPTVFPTVSTTYTLVVTDGNGCSSTPKFLTIDVRTPITVDFFQPLLGPDTSICPNSSATIDLTTQGGDGNYNFYLLPDVVNPITLPMEIQPSASTTYDFMVEDGCETPPVFVSSNVIVHEIPEVMLGAEPNTGCEPLAVEFSDLTQPNAQAWNWNFGDPSSNSNTSQSVESIHVYENAGSYDVSLSITTSEGCNADTILQNYVEVFSNPTAEFEVSEEVVTLLEAEIDFTDFSSGNVTYWTWSFGDGGGSFDENPTYQFNETGIFQVALQVSTDNGCTDEAYLEVVVESDFSFYVPNAFSPNNDRHNNYFRGYGEGVDWDTYSMRISNRWGELIYYTADIDSPWDGTFKGQQVELATYVYEISFFDQTGDDHFYLGHVTVVR